MFINILRREGGGSIRLLPPRIDELRLISVLRGSVGMATKDAWFRDLGGTRANASEPTAYGIL